MFVVTACGASDDGINPALWTTAASPRDRLTGLRTDERKLAMASAGPSRSRPGEQRPLTLLPQGVRWRHDTLMGAPAVTGRARKDGESWRYVDPCAHVATQEERWQTACRIAIANRGSGQ